MAGLGGSKSVMICSLTRAASYEIGKRAFNVNSDMIGTLHSHAYRALGSPELAETNIDEWNDEHPEYFLKISSKKKITDLDDTEFGETHGDQMLSLANNYRAKMIDMEYWREDVFGFYEIWQSWKQSYGYMDFTDLIETCIHDVPKAPGDPMTMLGDEAQDWSALEAKLFRDVWGKHADSVIMAGDFDQVLFEFRGADPEMFMKTGIKSEVLKQSFRVPRAVHKTAVEWIEQILNREKVVYYPTKEEGEVRTLSGNFKYAAEILDDVEHKISQGKTCMLLASCAYMLRPIIFELRQRAIPFSNPYRKINGAWNPLLKRKNATMPIDRITSFLAPLLYDDPWRSQQQCKWSMEELKAAISVLKTKELLLGGVKSAFEGFPPKTFTDLHRRFFLHKEDSRQFIEGDLDWYFSKLLDSKRKAMEYPIEIAKKHGVKTLSQPAKVIIGTIHSVKGGEADVVYLCPDISMSGMDEYASGDRGRNSIIRVFYVGMTRAREELILCDPSTRNCVEWLQ